ncbi:MAG: hypothetical protein HPY50_17420 [Firmicutes bacterium]|nr:hypothetical protein [Bacillota bacterium]
MRAIIIKLPKKWLLLALVLAAAAVGIGLYFWRFQPASMFPAGELVEKSIRGTIDKASYRYTLVATLEVDGRIQTWSDITGEKSGPDVHLIGKIINTPIEMYQIGSTAYNRDPFTNKWFTVEGYNLNEQSILMMEVNPLSNLNFKSVVEAEYAGREKVKGRDCWVVNCRPDLDNQLLEVLWQGFSYQLWIDRGDEVVRRAVLEAKSKNSATTNLKITMEFYDFDQPISLSPPK